MQRRLAVLAAILVGCGRPTPPAAAPEPATTPAPQVQRVPFVRAVAGTPTRVQWNIPQRDGQLTAQQLEAIAPRIARLRAEPDAFTVDVSGRLPMPQVLRVYAEDSSGTVLGEVRHYDHATFDGLTLDSLGGLSMPTPGSALFVVTLSERIAARAPARGLLKVRITVTDTSGRLPTPPPIPRGSAALEGIVTDSDGQPVARALVRVSVRGDAQRMRTVDVTVTDAAGRYRLEQLPAGELPVLVTRPGRAPTVVMASLRDGAVARRDAQLGSSPPPRAP